MEKERKWEVLLFLLHISHAISCCNVKVTDLYIGWSKEMMNTTTELLTYCTVQCIFELSCVMLKWLKDKPAVSYPLWNLFFYLKIFFAPFSLCKCKHLQQKNSIKAINQTVKWIKLFGYGGHCDHVLCSLGIWGL